MQRVVITGAASGIGRAVAQGLANDENRLLLVDRDEAGLAATRDTLGGAVSVLAVDLLQPDCGEVVAAAARATMGGCDGLVSNAGAIQAGSLNDLSVADFDRAFALNTRPTWLLGRALRPLMIEAGGGAIVATASLSAHHATPPLGAYAPSKAALLMLVRQLANEWGPDGIRVNSVSPGPTLTAMTAGGYADDERRRQRIAGMPLRRLGEAEDVANAILFLLGPQARQVSGIDLLVDGALNTTLMTASGAGSGQGN